MAPPSYNSISPQATPGAQGSMVGRMLSSSLVKRRSVSSPSPSISTPPSCHEWRSASLKKDPTPASATSASSSLAKSATSYKDQLKRDVDRAYAHAPRRNTGGLFKAACSTDLLFPIDVTASMSFWLYANPPVEWGHCLYSSRYLGTVGQEPYIDSAKEQIKSIVVDVKKAFLNQSDVVVAVVGYRDHSYALGDRIEFLDFTSSTDHVCGFLDQLKSCAAPARNDWCEDVLGGLQQAVNASWKQQTRCIIHIGDAPPHGRTLHDLGKAYDDYDKTGSDPHRLTYEPLLRRLAQLKVNYAFLRINNTTDRMALEFSQVYGPGNAKLHASNVHHNQITSANGKEASSKRRMTDTVEPQFEELQLGTSYNLIRHLVVSSVTSSVCRTAGRLSLALSTASQPSRNPPVNHLTAIKEEEYSVASTQTAKVCLETAPPQWPFWLDKTLQMEGFCPDVALHSASTLSEIMDADENIKLSRAELTIRARSKPFAQGTLRTASYASMANSAGRFVVKSFIEAGHGRAEVAEDMKIQALCKAVALEFNGLLNIEPPLDFIVTSCLESQQNTVSATGNGCQSLEPYIAGGYIKYNNNGMYVREDSPGDSFNRIAQAFSHFTFERSWGLFLVNDLQGVGHLLTDPSIQTRDLARFKLNETNLNKEGFKCFFAVHECNEFCRKLGLRSNREMFHPDYPGKLEFRDSWPAMDPTVCCPNKFCRNIIRLASYGSYRLLPQQVLS